MRPSGILVRELELHGRSLARYRSCSAIATSMNCFSTGSSGCGGHAQTDPFEESEMLGSMSEPEPVWL